MKPLKQYLCISLVTGLLQAEERIKIDTKVNAHYAITTVNATFTTGSSPDDVRFEMKMIRKAFVSGFTINVNGLECSAIVEDIDKSEQAYETAIADGKSAGYINLYNSGPYQKCETRVRIKANSTGFFLLTFEHEIVKENEQYTITIPVKTTQYYDQWSVWVEITEDEDIKSLENDINFGVLLDKYGNKTDFSKVFKTNIENKGTSIKKFFFEGNLSDKDLKPGNYISFFGNFKISYTTNLEAKLMETFVSGKQIAALIHPNPVLNPNPRLDIIVLIDTSLSMKGNKLDDSREALVGTILKRNEKLPEKDQVTLIQFHSYVVDLGTFTRGRKDQRNAKHKLHNIVANGYTDINGALNKALEVVQNHKDGGSTDIPLVLIFTDGKPEGRSNIVTDTRIILDNIRNKNTLCIPIYGIAVGKNADLDFIRKLSRENCGQAYEFKVDDNLIYRFEDIFEEIQVPIYSSKLDFDVKSDCVDETKLQNDLTRLFGKKFANTTKYDLINIPFKTSIQVNQPCQVDIVFKANVANKLVKEEIKLCFSRRRKRFHKLRDISQDCSSDIPGLPTKIPKGDFAKRLREYRDISEQVNDDTVDKQALSKRAIEANFVVDSLTALIAVVETENEMCESQPKNIRGGHRTIPRQQEKTVRRQLAAPFFRRDYSCKLEACDKSRSRGKCVDIYDGNIGKMEDGKNSLGPDAISSMKIEQGPCGVCLGYILYTEENFSGDSKLFAPGEYSGFIEMGDLFQEVRSLKAVNQTTTEMQDDCVPEQI